MFGRNKHSEPQKRSMREQPQKSAPVFSYYSSRNPVSESSGRRKETGRQSAEVPSIRLASTSWWILYLPSLISLAILAGAVLYLTTLSTDPRLDIQTSTEASHIVREPDVYQESVSEKLSGSLLNRSKLTIPTDKIAEDIQHEFPELGDVVVVVPLFGRKPIIEARPSQPSLVLVSQAGAYIVDMKGTVVLKASHLASSIRDSLPVVTDQTGMEIEIGKQILPTDSILFITELSGQFKAKNIAIDSILLPVVSNELHVRPAGKGYFIKFNTEYDARLQAGTYFALRDRLAGEGSDADEYIDVRIEERAYYR